MRLEFLVFGCLVFCTACFGSTSTVDNVGSIAGEGNLCEGIDPNTLNSPSSELTVEIGEGRTKLEFQPHIEEDRLELSQGAQGMAMIVYDLQVRGTGLGGGELCATIVANNRFTQINQEDYLPMFKRSYVLERNDDDFYAGPVYHPFGWNDPDDYQAEKFNVTIKVFVGEKLGTISREFELVDAIEP